MISPGTAESIAAPPTVLGVGEALLRLTTPLGERLAEAGRLSVFAAGAEANVTVALARLGVRAAWVSALPDVPTGHAVARSIAGAGVDVSGITWTPGGRVGLFFVDAGSPPRPTVVHYDRAGSAFTTLESIDPALLAGVKIVLLSGITPALGETSIRLAHNVAAAARAAGAALCVDVNHRSQLWDGPTARKHLASLIAEAAIVVCAHRDARTVFGASENPAEAIVQFREQYAANAEVVVLTRGAEGAVAIDSAGRIAEAAGVEAVVLDRFGAGDAFVAGLLWGRLEGLDLDGALRSATTLAALKCSVYGDHSLATRSELCAALDDETSTRLIR